MFNYISANVIIAIASGVVFGNLLPFPKQWWDYAVKGFGVAMVVAVGWVIFAGQ